MIGDDSGTINGALTFNGIIDEVGAFNQALSETQLQTMFAAGSGLSNFPATNTVALQSAQPLYPGQSALFSSVDGGTYPMTFTWQLDGVNLTDGANSVGTIYGAASPSLVISNLAVGTAGQTYSVTLVSSNAFGGAYTSSIPAMLTVSQPSAPGVITTTQREAAGTDWNTGVSWSDGNPVSVSVFSAPGSTYQIVPGTLERSPISTNAVFPGTVLVLQGDGVLLDGNAASFATQTTTAELRLKESGTITATNFGTVYTVGGSVTFPDLQLNGGQLDNGSSSEVELDGRIDVLANSAIYVDSAAAGSIRSFQVNAFLTGTGTVTYTDFGSGYASNALVISCPTNTFSGQWNVQQGVLVGNAPHSLGTNSISVGPLGALETTYNPLTRQQPAFKWTNVSVHRRYVLWSDHQWNERGAGHVLVRAAQQCLSFKLPRLMAGAVGVFDRHQHRRREPHRLGHVASGVHPTTELPLVVSRADGKFQRPRAERNRLSLVVH